MNVNVTPVSEKLRLQSAPNTQFQAVFFYSWLSVISVTMDVLIWSSQIHSSGSSFSNLLFVRDSQSEESLIPQDQFNGYTKALYKINQD